MRLKRLILSSEMLLNFFRPGIIHTECIYGIPKDSRIVSQYYNPNLNQYTLIIVSPEFDIVPEGLLIPIFEPMFKAL